MDVLLSVCLRKVRPIMKVNFSFLFKNANKCFIVLVTLGLIFAFFTSSGLFKLEDRLFLLLPVFVLLYLLCFGFNKALMLL